MRMNRFLNWSIFLPQTTTPRQLIDDRQTDERTDGRMLVCQFQAKLPKTDTDFNSVNVKLSELKFNFRVYLIGSLAGCLDIDLYIWYVLRTWRWFWGEVNFSVSLARQFENDKFIEYMGTVVLWRKLGKYLFNLIWDGITNWQPQVFCTPNMKRKPV